MREPASSEGDTGKIGKGWPECSDTCMGQRKKFLLFIVLQETEYIPREGRLAECKQQQGLMYGGN